MRNKKYLNLFLVLVLLMGMLPASAFPSVTFAEDEADQSVSTSATEVASQAELAGMTGEGRYILTNDITLSNWTPGNFTGTLDGNGHTITLNGTPLFDTLNGTVQNLLLEGTVTAAKNTGALAYTMTGGFILNSWSGASVTVTERFENVAGLVGIMSGGQARGVLVTGILTPGKFGGYTYGIAAHGKEIATFDTSYWTDPKAKYVAQAIKDATDTKAVTASDYDEILGFLNGTVAITPGLKAWKKQNGIPKPTGAISDGSAQIDKTALQLTLKKEQDYAKAEYTSITWNRLQKAIFTAKTILEDSNVTQRTVDNEVIKINIAIEQLITSKHYELLTNELAKSNVMLVDRDKYTSLSWKVMTDANKSAYTIHKNAGAENSGGVTDSDVWKAYTDLAESIKNLVKLQWVEISTADALSTIKGDELYILTADITDYKGNANTLTGKLDGNGHTIAFADQSKPLFHTIGEDAEVRNVGLTGKVTGGGAFAEVLAGIILNSYSWANVEGGDQVTGGIAGMIPAKHNAVISNTYVTGTVSSTATHGSLVGRSSNKKIFISNSYYINGDKGVGEGKDIETGEKITIENMKEESFSASLNKNRDKNGIQWNRNKEGLPYFGKEETPQGLFYPVVMKDLIDSSTKSITNKNDTLITDIFGQPSGYVAELELQGYTGTVKWKATSDKTNSPIIVASSSAKVFVRGPGTVKVTAMDAMTSEEIQSFTLTAEIPDKFELSLKVKDQDYTDRSYTVVGSETFNITPYVSIAGGESTPVSTSLFNWTSSNPNVINVGTSGYVDVNKIGSTTITVSLGNVSKTLSVDTSYTAVKSIKPAFEGTYYIHGRSPNSIGQNDTPGAASFNPLRKLSGGEIVVGSEFFIADVTPSTATYAKDYTTTTDNNKVLTYKGSMLNSLLPLKEGTVNLTVTSNDPDQNPKPSGSSKVTIKYFNPLTSLTAENDKLTVKKGEVIDAGLIFTGTKSNVNYHVTESNMNWTQTGTGEVSAYRSYPVIMPTDAASIREGTVSNDQWLIKGVKEGTVTLTGTPLDSDNGAKPITLTVNVKKGDAVEVKPAKERVSEILTKTLEYQAKEIGTPEFGEEWTILGLARAGYKAPENFYEIYYSSIYEKVTKEAAKESNRFGNSVTDVQRIALALTAIGKDPRDVNGVNLLNYNWNKGANFPGITPNGLLGSRQGSNELIFALLTVEANSKFEQPSDASITVQEMITKLLKEYQSEDGSFGLSDNKSTSVDMTAMAIQALAKHKDMPEAKKAADKAIEKLSTMQGMDGSYGTSESTSQVIIALLEMGIDPQTDNRFIKGGSSLLDGQLTYSNPDGSFAHSFGGAGNVIATDQAFYTFVALDRFYNNKNSLYNMNDVAFGDNTGATDVTGVNVSPSSSEMIVGNSVQLKATILPADAKNKSITWTSNKESIAKVSNDGLVTGVSAGTATITVTTTDGNRTATANITVVNPTSKPEVKKTITLSVETRTIGQGDIISSTETTKESGDTAFSVLKRLVDAKGISIDYIGSGATLYVQAINNLGEFDQGQGSGWMYSVNGVFPEYSAGLYKLNEGDILRWRYTTNLGADLNNPPPTTKPDPKPEKPEPKPPVIEAPKNVETVVKDNKVEIQIKDDKTGTSKPAPIEKTETVGDFLIVQIGGKGIDIPGGLELPKGAAPKVVVIDNDKPYEYYPVKSETKANKKWDVNFSGALLDSSENLDKVTVKDASGNIVDMKVKLSADGKTVSIHPSTEYEKGELYYITISGVTSASGKQLKQDIRSIFIVE